MTRAVRFTIHAYWSHRRAILVIGLGLGIVAVSQASAYGSIIGGSPSARAAGIAGMKSIASTFSVLIPPPVRIDTSAGFIDWRLFGGVPMYISIYTLIAGAAVIRGEEEKGLVEMWLSAGLGRVSLVLCRFIAMSLALATAATVVAGIGIAASRGSSFLVPAGSLAATCFLVMGPPLFLFALSMLLAQVMPSRRAAASLVGAFAGLSYVVANLSYTVEAIKPFRWISPFYYYDVGHALAEGTTFQPAYPLALLAATLTLVVLAAAVCRARDVNSPLISRQERVTINTHTLIAYPSGLVRATLYELRWTILGWTLGVMTLVALDTVSVKPVADAFGKSPDFTALIARLAGARSAFTLGYINYAVFVLGTLLVATLVINVISHFAADQEERRAELELAQPVSVLSIHVARYIGIVAAVLVATLGIVAALLLTAAAANIDLGSTHVWDAAVMVVALGIAIGSLGAALLPRFSRQAVAVLSAVVGYSFIVTVIGGLGNVPDWVRNLSLLKAFGSPAINGIETGGLLILVGVAAVGMVATAAQSRTEMTSG